MSRNCTLSDNSKSKTPKTYVARAAINLTVQPEIINLSSSLPFISSFSSNGNNLFIPLTIASTAYAHAPVHVQQAPRRREAVTSSGRRTAGVVCGREVGPDHCGEVERVQVVQVACRFHTQSGDHEPRMSSREQSMVTRRQELPAEEKWHCLCVSS
jgi:hypothetical protein